MGLSCRVKVILTTVAEKRQLSRVSHLTVNNSVHTSSQVVIVVSPLRETLLPQGLRPSSVTN